MEEILDRDTFARRQAEMTANWYEGVKRREGDVDAYIAGRQIAYLDRWQEAGRFIPDGSRILDVGAGNLYGTLFEYFKRKRLDYHYLDVDESAVVGSAALGARYGFAANKFAQGFNDQFAFADGSFDAVFSSHCIEHSFDLAKTFSELNRILKTDGNLLMAVPFGWEPNPEHPYFLGPDHWIALVEDHGFSVRVAQIGREYPESGYDYFIAARKVQSATGPKRIEPGSYRKDNYQFIPSDSASIRCTGNVTRTPDGAAAHMKGKDWTVTITLPASATEVLPVLVKHNWSGTVQIASHESNSWHDLFAWFPYVQPVRHALRRRAAGSQQIVMKPTGKNDASWSTEAVLHGVMYR
jgi:SAM-dependent methyltransferase